MSDIARKCMALACMLALAGCAEERGPVAPNEGTDTALPPAVLVSLTCAVDVAAGRLSCSAPEPRAPAGVAADLVVGGQDVYVRLASANVCYEEACAGGSEDDGIFQADVTVSNLMGQALGTADGITRDPAGVRIFFASGPSVTGGSGTVTVANADGTGTFTESGQAYFQYGGEIGGTPQGELGADGVLVTEEVSDAKVWQWNVPAGVTSFAFEVYVSAAVRDEEALGQVALVAHTVVAGEDYACGLTTEGAAYCWGENDDGQLGDGTNTDRTFPTAVAGGHVWATLSAHTDHTCGVTAGGAAYCWGDNGDGQLGDGGTTSASSPVLVQGGHSFASIAVGRGHTCGITTAGAAYCWGSDAFGQLGNGSDPGGSTPVAVEGGHVFTAIASGYEHTCGLEADGDVYCWGRNGSGQLGGGTTDPSSAPAAVDQSGTGAFAMLAAGASTTCGVTTGNAAYCWGSDINTELGDGGGASSGSNVPVAVSGGHSFTSITMGGFHGCGITTDSDAYCWGYNGNGAVGDGTAVTNRDAPTATVGGHTWAAVVAGANHTCGVTTANELFCWGAGFSGQIGNGGTDVRLTPTLVGAPLFETIAAGGQHTCGLNAAGVAYCWGLNTDGQLGDGTNTARLTPVAVAGGHEFASITTGGSHTCGVTTDDEAYCWGSNSAHQLGDGTGDDRSTPTLVANALTWASLAAGDDHACGVTTDDEAYCWGDPSNGRLGTGTPVDASNAVPLAVAGGHAFFDVVAGGRHTCGFVQTDDFDTSLYCWGDNTYRQLGDGTNDESDTPVLVPGPHFWGELALGDRHTCGTDFAAGDAVCWGAGGDGQLGTGAEVDSSGVPLMVTGGHGFEAVTAGHRYTCGLTGDGEAYCWGQNQFGQLGKGDSGLGTEVAAPTAVVGGQTFAALAAGWQHTCGVVGDGPGGFITVEGVAYCWGDNQSGQLGNGTTVGPEPSPVLVTAVPGVQWAIP